MADVAQRRLQANYLEVEGDFELLGAGFTELNESPSAQTSSKRYINDKSSTTRVVGYEWETSFTADQIKSEIALKAIIDIGKYQKVGNDCEFLYTIVDLDESVSQPSTEGGETKSNVFKARQLKVAVVVDSFDDNDGELAVSGTFVAIGDIVAGTFDTTEKKFTQSA